MLPPPAADRGCSPAAVACSGTSPARLGSTSPSSSGSPRVPERLADAVALYEDDLLVDADEEWLDAERERLKALYRASLAALVARLRAARDYPGAIAAARALLAHDPWREDTLRALIALR